MANILKAFAYVVIVGLAITGLVGLLASAKWAVAFLIGLGIGYWMRSP